MLKASTSALLQGFIDFPNREVATCFRTLLDSQLLAVTCSDFGSSRGTGELIVSLTEASFSNVTGQSAHPLHPVPLLTLSEDGDTIIYISEGHVI